MAEAIDSMTITLSPKYYKAIAAVYEYRRTKQSAVLTNKERDMMNFDIQVLGRDRMAAESWLSQQERAGCYVIFLAGRYRRGEEIIAERGAEVGRSTKYAVRKTDYAVVKAAILD
jgi:hypothetical protein